MQYEWIRNSDNLNNENVWDCLIMHLLLLLDCCHFKEASWRNIVLGLQTFPAVVLAVFMLYLMHKYAIKLFYIISVSRVLQYWNLILSINYFGFTLSCDSCSHGSVTNGWHFSFFFLVQLAKCSRKSEAGIMKATLNCQNSEGQVGGEKSMSSLQFWTWWSPTVFMMDAKTL